MPNPSKPAQKAAKKPSGGNPSSGHAKKSAVDARSVAATTATSGKGQGGSVAEVASTTGSSSEKKPKGRGKAARIPLEPAALLTHEGYDDISEWFTEVMKEKMNASPFCILNPSPAENKDVDAAARDLVTELNKKYKLLCAMDSRMLKRQSTPQESLDTLRNLKSHLKRTSAMLHDLLKKEFDTSKVIGYVEGLAQDEYHVGFSFTARVAKQFCKECVQHGKWDNLSKHLVEFCGKCDNRGQDAYAVQRFAESIFDMGLIKLVASLTGHRVLPVAFSVKARVQSSRRQLLVQGAMTFRTSRIMQT